ncbi:uncharacterized protein LAESUDRAFT_73002 [Laetiporus sulphureus 93-53]|uniref:Uncharacterized protein n=1 Tax=Laetiporus sulphureus 93-53 TaxID=1314785 RepID=A0A165EZN7_9APHY|nr:uncharacterized protein LAESUDRAFT_73002 [Laetiporus sulphureus 93-53]KZT08055.1 hypothetical protein LAESUDRAFT_73002 [Laetiporus sulphureus 93-53]
MLPFQSRSFIQILVLTKKAKRESAAAASWVLIGVHSCEQVVQLFRTLSGHPHLAKYVRKLDDWVSLAILRCQTTCHLPSTGRARDQRPALLPSIPAFHVGSSPAYTGYRSCSPAPYLIKPKQLYIAGCPKVTYKDIERPCIEQSWFACP